MWTANYARQPQTRKAGGVRQSVKTVSRCTAETRVRPSVALKSFKQRGWRPDNAIRTVADVNRYSGERRRRGSVLWPDLRRQCPLLRQRGRITSAVATGKTEHQTSKLTAADVASLLPTCCTKAVMGQTCFDGRSHRPDPEPQTV